MAFKPRNISVTHTTYFSNVNVLFTFSDFPQVSAHKLFSTQIQPNLVSLFVSSVRIFVNMDDNIIAHYTNHSAFLIEMSDSHGVLQITLMEL